MRTTRARPSRTPEPIRGLAVLFLVIVAAAGCSDALAPEPEAVAGPIDEAQLLTAAGFGAPAPSRLAVGSGHSCALRDDGVVECWGSNRDGQAPETVIPWDGDFVQIAAYHNVTCALADAALQTVSCWGGDKFHKLWYRYGSSLTQLDVGPSDFCAVRQDGVVECLELAGHPSTSNRVVRNAREGFFVQVSAGLDFACAVTDGGVVECWGDNYAHRAPARREASEGVFIQVAAGDYHACALTDAGDIECWGHNAYSQAPATREATEGAFVQVAAGEVYTCALRNDGVVECWGWNNAPWAPATREAAEGSFVEVAADYRHTCALTDDDVVECWGNNHSGQAPRFYRLPTSNRAPVADVRGPYTGDEGSAVDLSWTTSDADDDELTYSWDFGDGTTGSGDALPASHTWADDGTYEITLTASDGRKSVTSVGTAEIANVAPALSPIPDAEIYEGETYTASGTFVDPGADTHTATFSREGSTEEVQLAGDEFSVSHTFEAPGTYAVSVTVTDDDGATGTMGATVEVLPLDTDGDGVDDVDDAFPRSDLSPTVLVGGFDTGVPNQLLDDGSTFNDLLAAAAARAWDNRGQYVGYITSLANDWKKAGLISGRDHGRIVSAAARGGRGKGK